jgi:hypothetical protein
MDKVDKLLAAIRELGIEPVQRGGVVMMAATFEAARGSPLFERLSELLCEALAEPAFMRDADTSFYKTELWRSLRYQALAKHGNKCQCCGAGPGQGAVLHVDHIKPRSKFPELALSLENLQILCADCNLGKSNKDDTDWRA